MSTAIATLTQALESAMKIRPKVGGFPVLAEVLRQAGVIKNIWTLPAAQSVYLTTFGNVVMAGQPLIGEFADIPTFNRDALIRAIRTDQSGDSTFPEFLAATWAAGVVSYEVDFESRTVSYFGALGEVYVEGYGWVGVK